MNKRKNTRTLSRFILLPLLLLAALLFPSLSHATPYASGITNDAGTIRFFLNESNVTSIYVTFDNNTSSNNLATAGQTNVGLNFFSLGAHTNYQIIVTKTGTGAPFQISPTPGTANPPSTNLSIFGPRGVAVNRNPKSRFFGRIYIANASAGTTPAPISRFTHRGIFSLNPDYRTDAYGGVQGTNSLPPKANFPVGGTQWWGSSTTFSPFKLTVGKDDRLYVGDASGAGTTAGCPLWMMDPDLLNATPIKMFAYSGVANGTISNAGPISTTPVISGSLTTGDLVLTCMMYNYATNSTAVPGSDFRSVYRYNIGSGPIDSANVWGGNPTIVVTNTQPGFGGPPGIAGVAEELAIGPNGYVYVSYPRAGATGIGGGANDVWVYDNQVPANLLWASAGLDQGGNGVLNSDGSTNDFFVTNNVFTYGVAVSDDGNYIGFGNNAAANWVLMRLTNGIPDITTMQKVTAPNLGQRGVAFDAANNFYTVDGNSDSLRVYSLGQTTTAITGNDASGTNGTFQLLTPPASVSVSATVSNASQAGPIPGLFTLTRSGNNLNQPLTVTFGLTGTATNGVYTVSPAGITPAATNVITFAANQVTTNVTINPVVDSVPRATTTVILSMLGQPGYAIGAPATATVNITNVATPALFATNLDSQMYERTNDFARFRVTRLGDINADLTGPNSVNISFGGTAIIGTDYYTNVASLDFPPGVIISNIYVFPIQNGLVTGPKTITATVAPGSGYNVTTPPTNGAVIIVDSDLPPETILWSDSLTTDTSANWTHFFATTNDAPTDDFRINSLSKGEGTWPMNLATLVIPPAPHTTNGSDTGLYMTVNKDDSQPAAAALNFYPIGQSFSNNYALRFDMFLTKNDTSGQTEYALFGINHSGTKTNWFHNTAGNLPAGWEFDGVFFGLEADGAALGDYAPYSSPNTGSNPTALTAGTNASLFSRIFKTPPYAAAGVPANNFGNTTNLWADVEISQVNNVITWKINQTEIMSFVNPTPYTNGNIMLGYCDAYDSIGLNGGSVAYANVRVVALAGAASPINITSITRTGGNVTINFTAGASDTTANFVVQSSSTISGFSDVATTITSPVSGSFTTTFAQSGPLQFYRIRRLP